jgi:hypothetical protein
VEDARHSALGQAGQLGATGPGLRLGRERVTRRQAAAVQALAERTVEPGPSARARRHAAARGWTPDLLFDHPIQPAEHDIDHVLVDRAVAGEQVTLTAADLAAAVRRLHAAGTAPSRIATRLRTSLRRVRQILAVPVPEPAIVPERRR